MEQKKMLLVELDEKGIHTEVKGSPVDIMCMATEALKISKEALEKHPNICPKMSVKLMDNVVDTYQTEAHYGKEVAAFKAFLNYLNLR